MDYPAGVIVDDIIFSYIRESKVRPPPFDSCNSGTVVDLPYSFIRRVFQRLATTSNKLQIKQPQHLLISGCRDDQYSADAYQDGDGGALTEHS
jgi:hypothetical protein